MSYSAHRSLVLWRRRLAYRKLRLKAARRKNIGPRIARWKARVNEAEKMVAHRERQLSATRPMRFRALENARRDLDVREVGGNNQGPEVMKMIRANGGTGPEPWCGDAVAWWYRNAGSKLVERGWASTIWLLANLSPVKHPLPGHVVVYDFGTGGAKHTGLFECWVDRRAGTFLAIEGNTNTSSTASDAGGGEGVHRRSRTVNQVAGFRRVAR
jgi:hypothetical protein